MKNLPNELQILIILCLDLKSLMTLAELNRYFCSLISSPALWHLKKLQTHPAKPLASGAYFPYNPSNYTSLLFTNEPFDFSFISYKHFVEKLKAPRSLVKSSIESNMNKNLTGMLRYEDDLFWNSRQRIDSNSDEEVTCELISKSIIFAVSFKSYRAVSNGGLLFPPRFVRVSIGNCFDDFHYVSQIYKAPMSEKYCTIQILPEIVIGKYVKIEFLGKVTPMPGTEYFLTAIEFLDVIGSPRQEIPSNNLEAAICDKKIDVILDVLERSKHKATPFIVDQLRRYGILEEVLMGLTRDLNEVESFMFLKSRLGVTVDLDKLRPSEALGDLCFESGAFEKAFNIYMRTLDIWKLAKTAIVLKHATALKCILAKREPRYPRHSDLLTIANSLGPEFLYFVQHELN